MTAPFLEERLTHAVRYGSSWGDEFQVEITQTAGGQEYRRLVHPIPKRYFNIAYVMETDAFGAQVLDLYQRAHGMYAGFRVRAEDDYKTNAAAVTAFDQDLDVVTAASVYQLVKHYGIGTPLSIGRPVRTIFKPVAGTVKVGIGALELNAAMWTVDTTTGLVTLAANKTRAITGIAKASQAIVTVGTHTFTTNDCVYVKDVAGMTQINSQRFQIVSVGATTITLNVNSTTFGTYTGSGSVSTAPQTGEVVKGSCEFDIPCRFNSRLQIEYADKGARAAQNIELVELITL